MELFLPSAFFAMVSSLDSLSWLLPFCKSLDFFLALIRDAEYFHLALLQYYYHYFGFFDEAISISNILWFGCIAAF